MYNLVSSPACVPKMSLDEALQLFSGLGFSKFEAFSHWTNSAFDIDADPQYYLKKGEEYNISFTSFHLPPVIENDEASFRRAVKAAEFADNVEAEIVVFKSNSINGYLQWAKPFLDEIDRIGLIPVIQNRLNTPISTLEDMIEVFKLIGDNRMKALLEVGQLHKAGGQWREGCRILQERIKLVHIRDLIGTKGVPYGTGEIDFPGLFRQMKEIGYTGDYVIELEGPEKDMPRYLRDAIEYLKAYCL